MKKLLAIFLFFAGLSLSTQAQIQINSDFNVAAQRSVDGKQYKVVNNKHVPYADTTDFLATVPKTRRHIGQIAYIYGSEGRINVWQFIGGINQPNLHLVAPVAMSVNNSYPVQTIAEMLALDSLNVGDMVTVADSSKSYVLRYEPPTNFSNWLEVLSPLLASTDYLLEGATNLYYTDLRSRNAITGGAGITYDKPSGVIANAYNAIPGANMSITGAMPNITFAVTGVYTKQEVENLIRDSINNLSITNGTILNDSTFLLCNQSGCDTFVVQNISISSFTFTSDSTVLVCNTAGSCDTITFNPVALSKFYVDSVKLIPGAVDTVRYYINGVGYNGGYVNHLVPLSDGVITPGYVTWLHDSTFFVTSATYIKNATFYTSPADTITVSGIDATYPVKFVFVVDTTGHADYIVGVPATVPLDPQPDPASQLPLTAGITFNAGATTPSNVSTTVIYNEHTEWGTSTTGTLSINFENTVNPFNGVKNIDVASYSKNAQILFEGATQTVSDQILSAWAYLKVPLGNKNGFSFRFYNSATGASNSITVRSSFGLNPDLTNTWQKITIPISSAFQWTSQSFNKWVITMPSGASNGFKLDKIELQSGLQNIPPQTDYSNKVDSVTVAGAKVYWWVKGVRHLAGTPTDTAFINHLIKDSLINVKNNYYTISQIDSINNNHYTTSQVDSIVNIINNNNYTSSQIDSITNIINSNNYTISQIDSIIDVLRGEIVDASGGGVVSVAKGWGIVQDGTITSTGTVAVDSSIIKEALKQTFVAKTDTIPYTIKHLGIGYQTIFGRSGDTIYNKMLRAGTGMTITQDNDSSMVFNTDLSNYYIKSQIDAFLAVKEPLITAGTTAQYWRGDKTWQTFPTIPAQFNPIAGTGVSLSGTYPNITFNASGGTGTGKVYAGGHLANTNDSTLNADTLATNLRNEIALKQDKITLTTTGTSGSATLIGSTLNIPQYSSGGTTLNGTGFVKMAGTTPSYVTSPIDSASYHNVALFSDTTLILKRPNGINDSVSFHIGIPGNGWLLGGNIGTKSDSNFIGTKDTAALSFRVNNKMAGRIDSVSTNSGRTLFGFGAGASVTTDNTLTAFGYKAGNSITTSGTPTYLGNTAIGVQALYSATTTGYNTAVGYGALKLSTGTSNTVLGANAAVAMTTAGSNTAIGNGAMQGHTGSSNTAVGFIALSGSGTGSSNTVVGNNAMAASTINGSSNSAFGFAAGGLNASGSNNLYLGQYAGYNNTASNSIFISSIGSRGSLLNDQTQSPIYAAQSAINNYNATIQKISLNGKIGNNTISPTAWWNLSRGDGVTAPLKFEPPLTIAATGGSSTSTFFTINFATQTDYPFVWGTQVTLSGFTPSAYNGTWAVVNGTTSSISVLSFLNPGTVTVAGTITQSGLKTTPVNGDVENDSTAIYYTSGTGGNLSRSKLIKGNSGIATLSAGTVTISTTYIKANSRILVSVATPSGTQGFLSTPTASIVAGTSFVINSTSATETSTVNWLIINP